MDVKSIFRQAKKKRLKIAKCFILFLRHLWIMFITLVNKKMNIPLPTEIEKEGQRKKEGKLEIFAPPLIS